MTARPKTREAEMLAAHSEYQPVAANDSDVARTKNRRIEIVLLPLSK
jgi:flagellar motor protein MotB